MAAIGVQVKIVEPGIIHRDFSGRSFDFSNDEKLAEYQEIVKKVNTGFERAGSNGSEPGVVAQAVYRAVTDDNDQLRYIAGKDAEALIAKRKTEDDETFLQGIKEMFAL